MKRVLLSLAILAASAFSAAHADTYVQGHFRSNGTYVQPHHRSSADGNPYNNWSTQGNVNPYTGSTGTHNPNRY